MNLQQLAMPWAPNSKAYCLPGSVIVKMRLGEAPEAIPSASDVRCGCLSATNKMDGGVIDRIVRHFASEMRFSRVHTSAQNVARVGAGHIDFSDQEHVCGLARTFRLDVPKGTAIESLVDSLSQVESVENAMLNYVCTTSGASAVSTVSSINRDRSAWEMIRAVEALAYETGDPAIIVALIDSGISPGHPELLGRTRAGWDTVRLGQTDLALGVELLGDRSGLDTDPTDQYVGHGMGCAGVIGARGIKMPPGLAGKAKILPVRGLGAARFPGKKQAVGIGAISDLDMAMKMSVDLGSKVLNMSFGTDDDMLIPGVAKPHDDVVTYALQRGCILVAASGNSGDYKKYWPAAYPGVIAVGSVDAYGRPSEFTTRGDHVALCAPGENIYTLGLTDYLNATGTSFAAPFVSAAAALMVARAVARSIPLNSRQARKLLMESASRFSGAHINGCGAGILDAYSALQAVDAYIDQTLPDDQTSVEDSSAMMLFRPDSTDLRQQGVIS